MTRDHFKQYIYLMRLNKPIGIFLLLWPTLWALWIAGNGKPNIVVVVIFILGVVLTRSAGCIINDFADRNFDKHVARTRERPLTSGKISVTAALVLFCILMFAAFSLVLLLNRLTIFLTFAAAIFAVAYPFMKRFTHLPQVGLGVAFSWGIPMAFAALTHSVPLESWLLFAAAVIWPVIYDTMYAMVDLDDDVKIGVKSTAILFGNITTYILGVLQLLFIVLLAICGDVFNLKIYYFISLVFAALLFLYQLFLIKNRDREKCFKAFLNNHWVGMIIFAGILLSFPL